MEVKWSKSYEVRTDDLRHFKVLVAEIRDWRNKWAHQEPFSSDDGDRALDAGRIVEEVIAHLTGQKDADIAIILEIDAVLPDGASEQTVRTVTENCRTLKFKSFGFEDD